MTQNTDRPNTTLQQTCSPDITTMSNILYNQTLWTTQHALLSDNLPMLLLYALFNHPRLLIQVAQVQKAQFSYRLDGLVP